MFNSVASIQEACRQAERAHQDARQGRWKKNRDYYQNKQRPKAVPASVSYVVRNLCWSYVNLNVSKIVGGDINYALKGNHEGKERFSQALDNVLEVNKFHSLLIERLENYRQVEGFAGTKILYDPFFDGPYGIGKPIILVLSPYEFMLDPNSLDGHHEDDRFRIHIESRQLDSVINEAHSYTPLEEIPALKGKVQGFTSKRITNTTTDNSYVDVWEIEFIVERMLYHALDPATNTHFPLETLVPKDEIDGEVDDFVGLVLPNEAGINRLKALDRNFNTDGLILNDPADLLKLRDKFEELDLPMVRKQFYFVTKFIDGQEMLMPPKPTGYAGFTMNPVFHTPQHPDFESNASDTVYPISPIDILRDTQDRINVFSSIMVEVAKKSVKNAFVATGVKEGDKSSLVRKIGKNVEVIFLQGAQARVTALPSPTMPPHLVQQYQMDMESFNLEGNTNEPDRGQPIDLSGKAIVNLQARADLANYISIVHLSAGLEELFRRLIELMQSNLTQPLAITVDKQEVAFNTPTSLIEPTEGDFLSGEDDNQVINRLKDVHVPGIKIDIVSNTILHQQVGLQKAATAFSQQLMHPERYLEALFPDEFREIWTDAQEWNTSLALAQAISSLPGEIRQVAEQQVMQFVQAAQVIESENNPLKANTAGGS